MKIYQRLILTPLLIMLVLSPESAKCSEEEAHSEQIAPPLFNGAAADHFSALPDELAADIFTYTAYRDRSAVSVSKLFEHHLKDQSIIDAQFINDLDKLTDMEVEKKFRGFLGKGHVGPTILAYFDRRQLFNSQENTEYLKVGVAHASLNRTASLLQRKLGQCIRSRLSAPLPETTIISIPGLGDLTLSLSGDERLEVRKLESSKLTIIFRSSYGRQPDYALSMLKIEDLGLEIHLAAYPSETLIKMHGWTYSATGSSLYRLGGIRNHGADLLWLSLTNFVNIANIFDGKIKPTPRGREYSDLLTAMNNQAARVPMAKDAQQAGIISRHFGVAPFLSWRSVSASATEWLRLKLISQLE